MRSLAVIVSIVVVVGLAIGISDLAVHCQRVCMI
jgi:hypothetical protein